LEQIGKHIEAVDELEFALSTGQNIHEGTMMRLLAKYAKIATNRHLAVPSSHREAFEKAAGSLGINVSPESLSSSLTQAILDADVQEREAQRRYDALLDELRRASPERHEELRRRYIASEPIDFYRTLACRALGDHE
jgi:uncharacterized protein (DUF1501 family)